MVAIDQTRLNVPMPRDMRDAVEKRWRESADCRGASEYVRKLIQADLAVSAGAGVSDAAKP